MKRTLFFLVLISPFLSISQINPRPKKGDIPFSIRFHPDKVDNCQPNRASWLDNFNDFNSNSVLWSYWLNKKPSNVSTMPEQLITTLNNINYGIQYTIPNLIVSLVNDQDDLENTKDLYGCKNLLGAYTNSSGQPWEVWVDITKLDFLEFMLERIKPYVDKGNISFHQDGVSANLYFLELGGCFSDENNAKFRVWLNDNSDGLSPTSEYLDSNFNIDDYLRNLLVLTIDPNSDPNNQILSDQGRINIKAINDPIIPFYEKFLQKEITEYYGTLHNDLNTYIDSVYSGAIGNYSANNIRHYYWPSDQFDFWNSELYIRNDFPYNSLSHNISKYALFTKSTLFKENDTQNWNSVFTLGNSDLTLNKKAIPLAYSTGLSTITPWDIYAPNQVPVSGQCNRFFGIPSDYDDLYSFISTNKEDYFSNHTSIEESNYVFMGYHVVEDKLKYTDTDPNTPNANKFRINISYRDDFLIENSIILDNSEVKIGNTVYTIDGDSMTGVIKFNNSDFNGVQIGDVLWYIKSPDGNYEYKDKMYDWSLNNPEIDITQHSVTDIKESDTLGEGSPGGIVVFWELRGMSLTIPTGSEVLIGETKYYTSADTGVGNLYFQSLAGMNINDPIWYVKSPEGDVIYPKERPFVINAQQTSFKESTSVYGTQISNYNNGTERMEVYCTGKENFGKIPEGSEILINSKRYKTIGISNVGNIYLNANAKINTDDKLWYIKNPEGEIIYPKKNNLTINNITHEPQNNRTAIQWGNQPSSLNIPLGSKVKINNITYETVDETNVGNIYITDDAINDINIGDKIWYVYDQNDNLILPTEVNYSNTKLHLISLEENTINAPVTVKLRKHRFGIFNDLEEVSSNYDMIYEDVKQYNYYKLNGLKDWSILNDYNMQSSRLSVLNNLTNEEKLKNVIIYPNPTNDMLSIKAKAFIDNISLYDINGRLLKTKKLNDVNKLDYELNVKDLSNGIYLLKVQSDKIKQILKFIKN